jgi:hypothetical protein
MVVTIILVAIIIIFYKKGYRLQDNFMIGKVGNLSLVIPLSQTNIFIDDKNKIITSSENEKIEISLSPRKHTVIISREGYYPWKKDVVMQSEGKIIFNPVFVSSNPSGSVIEKTDPEFWKIRNQIITDKLPTKDTPKISKDGSAKLWVEDNAVIVSIASTTKTVIQPDPAIENVYFYKDRNDVIILSVSNGVYAMEVDKENTQNFLPIYKGISPSSIEGNQNYIYVLDNDILMKVVI